MFITLKWKTRKKSLIFLKHVIECDNDDNDHDKKDVNDDDDSLGCC